MKFSEYPVFEKLSDLAQTPPDLTKPGMINERRVHEMVVTSCSWRMLYATERVNKDIEKALCELSKQANVHEKMWDMQNMEMMNYINNFESEERRVGHTAMRHPSPKDGFSKEVEEVSKDYQFELKKLKDFLPKVESFQNLIVVGIGGSFLGSKAVWHALKRFCTNNRRLYFASNVDPDKIADILEDLDLKKTLVAVISKSGETLEIKSQEALLKKRFNEAKLNPKDHFLMVTGKESPMNQPSQYLETFYMWDFIGGRYSVSSMVGALPISFMLGMNVWTDFLNGLHDMDHHVLNEKDPMKNLPLWGALLGIWNRNFLHCDTYAIIPYSQGMDQYSLHLQQLFMESNGKSVCQEDGSFIDWDTCPVIWGTVGTEGQHSYYQALHQSPNVVPTEFIGFRHSQWEEDEMVEGTTNQEKLISNMLAQPLALARGEESPNPNKYFEGNRPSHSLISERLDGYSLGNLLGYHEHYVVYQGWIWGINSFDQEGVQLGKVAANNFANLYKEQHQKGTIQKTKENEVELSFLHFFDSIHEVRHKPKKRKIA